MWISAVIGQHSTCNNEKTYTTESAVKGPRQKIKKNSNENATESIYTQTLKI